MRFIQDRPMCPEEIAEGKIIYPFRFQFHVDYVLEQESWLDDRIKIPLAIQEMRRGVNLLQERTITQLYEAFANKFRYVISSLPDKTELPQKREDKLAKDLVDHSKIQELIFEIGKLNRFISEKEYPMENERLDV